MRIYNLYQVVDTERIYRYDNASATLVEVKAKELPFIRYKEQIKVNWQLLNSPDTTDVYTGFVGETISVTASLDDDWYHYDEGALVGALSGAITEVTIAGLVRTPPKTGRIILINATDDQETVSYTAVVASGSNYVFTVSTTLANTYADGDVARVNDELIIKTENADIDSSNKDTGLFIVDLNGFTSVFQTKIQGSASISGCILELQVTSSSELSFVIQADWQALNIIDDSGAVPPAGHASDYFTRTESLATFVPFIGTEDVEITDSAKGLILKSPDGTRYRLTVADGGYLETNEVTT